MSLDKTRLDLWLKSIFYGPFVYLVRTPPSQGGEASSNLVGATQLRDVGELVDPPDLGSGACNGRVGSSPTISTNKILNHINF